PSSITYLPVEGNFISVHSSHNSMGAGITMDFSATLMMEAPSLKCVLIQGSKGVPSSLFQPMYSSIGMSGYLDFKEGRTGATIFLKFPFIAKSLISFTMMRLNPLFLCCG